LAEFVLILLVPPLVALLYYDVTNFIQKNNLSWLFTEESERTEFDKTLKRMPAYSTTEVAYSYAKDAKTVCCRLQIMMCCGDFVWK
jgi:hypothetical protein